MIMVIYYDGDCYYTKKINELTFENNNYKIKI